MATATEAKQSAVEITADLRERLRVKYSDQGWAFAGEVHNETGARSTQKADAIAMGIWPSRGYEIHGFEIKAIRSDWLKELNTPSKADEIACQCDYWWIVAAKDIVRPNELPDGWGLMVPAQNGLKVSVRAARRDASPIGRGFVAAFIRRVCDQSESSISARTLSEKKREYDRGYKNGLDRGKSEANVTNRVNEKFDEIRTKFFDITGRDLNTYTVEKVSDQFKRYADADDFFKSREYQRLLSFKNDMESLMASLEQITKPAHAAEGE